MPNNYHREAEHLSAEASKARVDGRSREAIDLYSRAAEAEEAALSAIGEDKTRTRSILSLSVASLLYKAERLEEAELRIFQLLGSRSLEPWADRQLRDLLQVVSDERTLTIGLGRKYSGESIIVALRGGEIGSGTGPLDLILEKAAGFKSLLYRFAEWTGQYPLRRQGNPPKELMELIQARAMEPTPGSYRLEVRLTEPSQLSMFEAPKVNAEAVSNAMFKFLDHLVQGSASELEELVPQAEYRKAFLQLTRNIAPAGKRLKEVGIYRRRHDQIQSVYLTDAVAPKIREALPRKKEDEQKPRVELTGILRALHLDRNWLVLIEKDGKPVKCDTVHDMLDDVVGPMVNREVIVSGPMRMRSGLEKLLVEEIEVADEPSTD